MKGLFAHLDHELKQNFDYSWMFIDAAAPNK